MADKNKKLNHPLLNEANTLASEGKRIEASNKLIKLFNLIKEIDVRVKILFHIANLLKFSHYEKSIEFLKKAISLNSNSPEAWLNYASLLYEKRSNKNNIEECIKALTKASELNPKPSALVEIGRFFSMLGNANKAIELVRNGYEKSNYQANLSPYVLRVALQYAEWDLSELVLNKIKKNYNDKNYEKVAETPRTHLLWCDDEQTNIKVISDFAKKAYPEKKYLDIKYQRSDVKKNKIRIGYISYDFREHATSLLALGLMRHHNKNLFEIYAYCCSFDDGSALRREILSRFDNAKTLHKFDDFSAAKLIQKDELDILVDLNGLTDGSRLGILAYKPAPLQISYLGFPGTCGGRFIDYIIADEYVLPGNAANLFPEKIIKIPVTYQVNDYRAKYLPPKLSRTSQLLPEDVTVIGMFNNINKVSREVWVVWLEILKNTEKSILWVLNPGELAQENLMREARKHDISADRILFAAKEKQDNHFSRLQQCDIVLDPWPYGGHTTTSDALFAGVPVVALEGRNFASRVSGGLLKSANLENLICKDVTSYIKTAIFLVNNKEELKKIKLSLLKNRFKLDTFDAVNRTKQIETAFIEIHKRRLANKPATNITIISS